MKYPLPAWLFLAVDLAAAGPVPTSYSDLSAASHPTMPIPSNKTIHEIHISAWGSSVMVMKPISFEDASVIIKTIPIGAPAQISAPVDSYTSPNCQDEVRPEWKSMDDDARLAFVNAIQCLTTTAPSGIFDESTSIWDDLTWVHVQNMGIHGTDVFLPWHRYYLHVFKTMLADHCEYTAPLPWWRETDDAGNIAGSGIFAPEYFGGLPPMSDGSGSCLAEGPFAGITVMNNGTRSCVERGEDVSFTSYIDVSKEDLCQGSGSTSYLQHADCVQGTIHVALHSGVGPTMANLYTAPADPIFFVHHGYVDWEWAKWQKAGSGRNNEIVGCTNARGNGEPCNALTYDTVLSSQGLIPDMTVKDVLDTENSVMCYTYNDLI